MDTLNQSYSSLSARRRYEVWFLRLGLADGSGAWWFRYLLMNPGRSGCAAHPLGGPVQVWATWFPAGQKVQSFIQSFPVEKLSLSPKGQAPFQFSLAENTIAEDCCRGHLTVAGHEISWNLRYRSSFHFTMSDKGWIGFSRTPHSDATFSGHISLDGRSWKGDPLGFGVQGHNCGYRHRAFWTWTHAYFADRGQAPSTFEALIYEMPLRLLFRKAVLWHEGRQYIFRKLEELSADRADLRWNLRCSGPSGIRLEADIDGQGSGIHRLPYLKTDCSGTFEVVNNSRANAILRFDRGAGSVELLESTGEAVLEMGGER